MASRRRSRSSTTSPSRRAGTATTRSRWWSRPTRRSRSPISIRNTTGGFFGGDLSSTSLNLLARRGERLTSELTWDHNDAKVAAGSFQVNLGRLRLSYSITPRMLVQALAQYNDQSDNVSTNLRFSWLQDANTGLFVVYNEIDELGARILYERPDRTVIVKYSRLVDIFR